MFIEDKNSILPQVIADWQNQLKKHGFDGSQKLVVHWNPTTFISQEINNLRRFKGVLKDKMGTFKADIRRNGDVVKIYFEGVGTRTMSMDQARWELDMIWNSLAKQNKKILVMS